MIGRPVVVGRCNQERHSEKGSDFQIFNRLKFLECFSLMSLFNQTLITLVYKNLKIVTHWHPHL